MPISFTRATWVDFSGPPHLQASELNRLETAIDALINGTSRAVYRDGDTITGNLTVNGWIEADQGFRDAGGVTRISATGAGVFSQATVSDVADTRVMFAGTAGRVTSDASFLYIVGTGRLQTGGRVGFSSTLNFRRAGDGAAVHFETGNTGTNAFLPDTTTTANNPHLGTSSYRWQSIYGGLIDSSGSVNAATSLQTAGVTRISSTGAGTFSQASVADLSTDGVVIVGASGRLETKTNLTYNPAAITLTIGGGTLGGVNAGSFQTSGVTRISSTGAGTLASLTVADLTANLPVYADASKKLATESASAFRARIGAASDASEKATAGRVWRTRVTTSTLYTEYNTGVTAYGGGVWVQALGDVSAGSTVARRSTDDGATWTGIVLPVAARWYGLTWCSGSSLFILVGGAAGGGGAGVILTSPNGTTWTSRTNSLSYPYSVAANGNTVIAACNNGTTHGRSTDGGVTWTTFAAPGGYGCQSSAFAGGRFVLIGNNGAASSADGTTWASAATPSFLSPTLGTHSATFFAGVWWMVVYGGLYRSTNGHTWTAASAQTGWFVDASPTGWRSITSSGNAMIAHVETAGGDLVLVSIDGVWWDLARNYGNLIGTVSQQGSQFYTFGYRGPTQGFTAYSQA